MLLPLTCLLALSAIDPIPVSVPDRPNPVAYAEVADILAARCLGCHATGLEKGRLNLETVESMRRGGKHGPALVPGKADESLLFRRAAHREEPTMPPKDQPDARPLTPEELGLLKLWIDAGAMDDGSQTPQSRPAKLGSLPPGVHPINAVDLTPDGRLVACGRANLVQVYEVETGKELVSLAGHQALIQSLRFSPDGTKLAAGSYERVTVWLRPADDQGVWQEWLTLTPHADRVQALDFNPDGTLLASGAGEPSRSGQVTIWETGKGMLVRRIDGLHSDTVMALRFSPDGKTLATASADKLVKLINVSDGLEKATLEGHTHHVLGLDWKADGQQLASGGADGVLKLWDASGEPVRSMAPLSKPITGVRWSRAPGPEFVAATSGDHRVHLWNVRNGAQLRTLGQGDDYLFGLSLASTRSTLAAGGAQGTLYLWDSGNGTLLKKLDADTPDNAPKHK